MIIDPEAVALGGSRTVVAVRWRLFGHPFFTGALAVLAVNDHLLKGRAPGALTGKLSDFAGVFVFAVAGAILIGRPRLSCCVSGLGFAAIKTLPMAAALAAPFLGGTTRRDPTDLLSLMMLYPAYRLARRVVPSASERPIRQQVLTVASATVAVFAISATSYVEPAGVDGFAVVGSGAVFARVYDESYDDEGQDVPSPRWAKSIDGGASWLRTAETPSEPVSFAKEACSPNLGCFRVGDHRVEHSAPASGGFATSFAFSKEQRERIKQRADPGGFLDKDGFRAVAIVNRSEGDHVVVAMGSQGALHRSPDGRWTRVAVLDRRPVPLHGPSWLADLSLAPLAALVLSPVVFIAGWGRRSKARGFIALAVAIGASFGLLSLAGALLFLGLDYAVAGPLIAGMSVGVLIASMVVVVAGKPETGTPPLSAPAS